MLKIVHIPNPVLTSPTTPVKTIDAGLHKLVAEMEKTLVHQKDPEGVGLAATQVGESMALFIMKPNKHAKTEVFINPHVLQVEEEPLSKEDDEKDEEDGEKKEKKIPLEGCLSIPKIWAPIARTARVQLEYLDETGKKHTRWFSGFKAIIVQHEVDHLNGILFTQRALEQGSQLYEEQPDGELVKKTI